MIRYIKRNLSVELFLPLIWGTLAGTFNQGLNFITNIFLARFLKNDFGELILYQSTNSMLQTFSLVGLGTMVTVLIAKNLKLQDKELVGSIISNSYIIVTILSIFIAFICIIFAIIPQTTILFWKFNSTILFLFVIIWFIFSSIDALQVALLIGFSAFKHIAIASFVKGVISLLLISSLAFIYGIEGALLGYAIGFMISACLNLYFLQKNIQEYSVKISLKINIPLIWKIINSGIPIFLAALFITPVQWFINNYIFSIKNGHIALSLFGIANQWMILIQFFPLQISKVVLPFLSGTNNYRRKTEHTGLFLSIFIAILLIFLSFIFEKQIIHLYGFEHSQSKEIFRIMLLSAFFSILNLYFGQTIIASGKPWLRTLADMIIALALFITFIVIINYSVMLALPIAYCIALFIGSATMIILKNK